MFPPPGLLNQGPDTATEYLARVGEAGIDYVCCGDHVSFFGLGFDGLVQATALAMLHPALPVHVGVYLLPLRHPVLVARQLADFAGLAPGRLVLGVGVGGEDRHEVSVCGVDPATRGSRMNECLAIVRQLLDGSAVSFHGTFFDLDEAVIADSKQAARACLAPVMEAFYQLPFERFERYCPYGTADDVAEFLTPYVDAGCTEFNLIPQSPDQDQAVAGVAAVKKQLARP